MDQEALYVSLEFTPNPNTLKYAVNRTFLSRGAREFTELEKAKSESPLAEKLLGVSGISGVMIGRDFITVTKAEDGDWDHVHKNASSTIETHLNGNEKVVNEDFDHAKSQGGSEVEQKIIDILDKEIRPAVAMDGGDITFDRFENGKVFLVLQGSCAGCPSSTATLKDGIETRLKAAIPSVQEVVSVS